MNDEMLTRWIKAHHAELMAEAAAERLAATAPPRDPRPRGNLRHRAARLLHDLADTIDSPPRPSCTS